MIGITVRALKFSDVSRWFGDKSIVHRAARWPWRSSDVTALTGLVIPILAFAGWRLQRLGEVFEMTLAFTVLATGYVLSACCVARRQLRAESSRRDQLERSRSVLGRAGRVLVDVKDLTEAFQRALNLVIPDFADAAIIGLINAEGDIEWSSCRAEQNCDDLCSSLRDRLTLAPRMRTLLRNGRSIFIPDVSARGFAKRGAGRVEDAKPETLQSCVVVPIRVHGVDVGILAVATASGGRTLSREALLVTEELARLVGLTIYDRTSRADFDRAMRAREEVLAIVSHDLRSPLAAIKSGAQLASNILNDDVIDLASARDVLGLISGASERMLALLGDLLDLSRIEAGYFRIEPVPVPVATVIESAAQLFRPVATDKFVRFEAKFDAEITALHCDHDRINQVLTNLLSNAFKHTPRGGTVTLAAHALDPEWVEFTIDDSGPGISPECLPHLFDRYWQPRDAIKSGVGLGLFIAKGIIDSHGGEIGVSSQPGCGSRFWFKVRRAASTGPYAPSLNISDEATSI